MSVGDSQLFTTKVLNIPILPSLPALKSMIPYQGVMVAWMTALGRGGDEDGMGYPVAATNGKTSEIAKRDSESFAKILGGTVLLLEGKDQSQGSQ